MSFGLRRLPAALKPVLATTRTQHPLRLHVRLMSTTKEKSYEYILVERPVHGVGLVRLNRPKALNALCSPLFDELNEALTELDADDDIGALVLTGSERAFAGARYFASVKDSVDPDVT